MYLPSPHPVNLQVDPPDTRCADDEPQSSLLAQRPDGQPLQEAEVAECYRDEDG